jgi:hypothetical protein
MDPLSLAMHEVLVQVLSTSIHRGNNNYAAALVHALLALEVDQQPGACCVLPCPYLALFVYLLRGGMSRIHSSAVEVQAISPPRDASPVPQEALPLGCILRHRGMAQAVMMSPSCAA